MATHGGDDLLRSVLGLSLPSWLTVVQQLILFLAGTHAYAGLVCSQSVARLHLPLQCMFTAMLTCLSVVHTVLSMLSAALLSNAHSAMTRQLLLLCMVWQVKASKSHVLLVCSWLPTTTATCYTARHAPQCTHLQDSAVTKTADSCRLAMHHTDYRSLIAAIKVSAYVNLRCVVQIVMTANTVVLCYIATPKTPKEHVAAAAVRAASSVYRHSSHCISVSFIRSLQQTCHHGSLHQPMLPSIADMRRTHAVLLAGCSKLSWSELLLAV